MVDWFALIILPILIFLSRIIDVSIGTLRIVFVSKGYRHLAPIFGFFEVLIWIIAMGKIFQNLDNWIYYIAYASGFATGNYVGLLIEEKLAIGYVTVRIITQKSGDNLITSLIEHGYGITHFDANGSRESVNIIYCITKRTNLKKLTTLVKKHNPLAFYTIDDVKMINKGVFPLTNPKSKFFSHINQKRK